MDATTALPGNTTRFRVPWFFVLALITWDDKRAQKSRQKDFRSTSLRKPQLHIALSGAVLLNSPQLEFNSTPMGTIVWHGQLGTPRPPVVRPADPAFERGTVMESSTSWQPMSMILIARPTNRLGMDLYEGRTAPGIRGAREPARSQRGPAPVAGGPTRITRSSSSTRYEDSECSCCHARRTGPSQYSVEVNMTTLRVVLWMSGRSSSNINSPASRDDASDESLSLCASVSRRFW
ncbi:hypothetical protein LA080_004954 [Diaporthe eres]|nr:hypothetical protein LA080_004954 [Diaporthe eres]